jgi:hypothetical protein
MIFVELKKSNGMNAMQFLLDSKSAAERCAGSSPA